MNEHRPRSRFVTAKEIAAKLELNPVTIRRKERALGLSQCRDRICARPRRYHTEAAELALRNNGHEVTF